jgi:hypothetical protein
MHREYKNLRLLPQIQAQVIGYDLALKLFQLIEHNKPVNEDWRGTLNVTYTYGGALTDEQ